jgi:hypothetical protein
MPTWEQVIDRFASRTPNKRNNGRVSWEATASASMHDKWEKIVRAFCDERALYSYGRHFVLAHYLGQDTEGRHVFLKNGDRNSPTTNRMVAHTQRACYGPTVSMSALESAGIAGSLTLENIVDWRNGTGDRLYRDKSDGKFYRDWDHSNNRGKWENPRPSQGMWIPYRYNDDDRSYEMGDWHVLGAVLIRSDRGDYYLCSLDEGRYFVSKLAGPAATVDEAFASLKPEPVREAEREGMTVIRQGEWFFVATGQDDAALAQDLGVSRTRLGTLARVDALPRDRADSNRHDVKQVITPDGRRLAKGKVFHRTPGFGGEKGTLTREHRTINLGETWHLVYQNTQQAAWSMGGNFD